MTRKPRRPPRFRPRLIDGNHSEFADRILVVDDHTLFRRGLTALFGRDPRFCVVGDAADAGEAQRRTQELQPDLILLDNHLPGVNGVDALPALLEAAPAARVLMLTVSEDEADLSTALRNGAAGYLLKTIRRRRTSGGDPARDARRGRRRRRDDRQARRGLPRRGGNACGGSAARIAHLSSLSPREQEILRGIARGASNKTIARELGIAETTVKIHVQHVLRQNSTLPRACRRRLSQPSTG